MLKYIKQFFIKKHSLESVFTPSTSAELTFVDRPDLYKQINRALLLPGTQIIMYGQSGCGKTTIIQNILAEKKIEYITTNCSVDTSVNNILLLAFDKLNPFYTAEQTDKKRDKISADFKNSYKAIDLILKTESEVETQDKKVRALPLQLTPQRLAEFLGEANVLWVIEDFHKVAAEEKQKLSQMFKIFVDISNKYKQVKIIAIGAVGTARDVVNYDPELNNRVAEIQVPLMKKSELETIIVKGEKLLNVNFNDKVRPKIINISNGLPSICHQLCFSMCHDNNILKTKTETVNFEDSDFSIALHEYGKHNSDSFKATIDRALRSRENSNCKSLRPILVAFCQSNKDEMSQDEVLSFENNKKNYPNGISECLNLLTTSDYGEILRYDEVSGKYSFSNPFIKVYTQIYFENNKETATNTVINIVDIYVKILKGLFG